MRVSFTFLRIGPIHKEMRRLIASLQSSNQQLKAEAARYKRKFQDAYHQLEKVSTKSFRGYFEYWVS